MAAPFRYADDMALYAATTELFLPRKGFLFARIASQSLVFVFRQPISRRVASYLREAGFAFAGSSELFGDPKVWHVPYEEERFEQAWDVAITIIPLMRSLRA